MHVGIFDHLDQRNVDLSQYYDDRLELVSAYDRLGFYAYHVAEHHFTPLGLSPSPSVYLSSVAQRTQRILFGPLVYTLPLYHPLRLADEISMLDHLSKGRLQLGVGRGVSPIEVGYFGVEQEDSQPMYLESYQVLIQALTREVVDFKGKYFEYKQVPMVLKPFQKPHPPIWYGVGNADGADWCVANSVNSVVNGPLERVKNITDRFWQQWATISPKRSGAPLIGTSRHVVVSQSSQEALDIAKPAYEQWHRSFMHLFNMHGIKPQFNAFPDRYEDAAEAGLITAGKPQDVLDFLVDQIERSGVNYLLCRFAFGSLELRDSLNSCELFAKQVMPRIQSL